MRRRWFPIQLKRALRHPGTYVIALLLLLTFLLVNYVRFYDREQAPFGLIAGDGICAGNIVSRFKDADSDSPIRCRIYQDEKTMRRDVLAGRLDCGFILKDNLDESVFEETKEPAVIYLHTAATRKGLVVREQIYAALIDTKAEQILDEMAHSKKSFKHGDDELARRLIERKNEYLESDDIFQVIFETEDGSPAGETDRKADPLMRRMRLIWVLILAAAMAFARERYSDGFIKPAKALRRGERVQSLAAYTVSATAPTALVLVIAGIAAIAVTGVTVSAGMIAVSLISCLIALIISSLLATLIALAVKSETAYLYLICAVTTVAALLMIVVNS